MCTATIKSSFKFVFLQFTSSSLLIAPVHHRTIFIPQIFPNLTQSSGLVSHYQLNFSFLHSFFVSPLFHPSKPTLCTKILLAKGKAGNPLQKLNTKSVCGALSVEQLV